MPVPTARELQALAALGAQSQIAQRVGTMNELGRLLGIPSGGWHDGQSRLFDGSDIRLIWLLRRLAHASISSSAAQNLERTSQLVGGDAMLTVVVAARENTGSITALSMQPIQTWDEGGLDFLWKEKDKLGLPVSVTQHWRQARRFESPETHRIVYPANIPARDQVLAYAAQLRASLAQCMSRFAQKFPGSSAWEGCRAAMLIWKAYAFLAPGGAAFDASRSVSSQLGQGFGCQTALAYLASRVSHPQASASRAFDQILSDAHLNKSEWVRIAKVRAAEALYLEQLLKVTRLLLLPGF